MWPAFPTSDYYTDSVPPNAVSRRWTCPSAPWMGAGRATPGGSHVHCRTGRRGRCPALPLRPRHGCAADLSHGLPTGEPQPVRELPAQPGRHASLPSPHPPDSSWWVDLSGIVALVPRVHLLISLAGPGPSGSTGPSRRCRGGFPPSLASPRSGCPQLLVGCCDSPRTEPLHLRPVQQRLVAH